MQDILDKVQDAPESLGTLFLAAIRNRDKGLFNSLLQRKDLLWGGYFNQLSEKDKRWARQNVER